MSSWCTLGLDRGGSGGLNEPDAGLGGRITLGSVPGASATLPKVHHMDRSQKRGGAGRLAAARWATSRAGRESRRAISPAVLRWVRKVTPWLVRKVTPWLVRKVTPWIDGFAPLTDNVGRDQDRGRHVRREQMSWHTEHG